MNVPSPTPIFRLLHVESLETCLRRGGLHAPHHTPNDRLPYRTIHNVDIQNRRRVQLIPCGPGGVIHDYVSFYFGPRPPMLLQLHTGRVPKYSEGQEPLIYVVSTAQAVQIAGVGFVFSDGHGMARFTRWFNNLAELDKVDWEVVYATTWCDTVDDPDRQRRKQAEFLVHRQCAWGLIHEVGVLNERTKTKVEHVLTQFPHLQTPPVNVHREWYY